jgi:hypothetical protein
MEVSKEMRRKEAQQWTKELSETSALTGGLTALINPEVYRAGIEALEAIILNPELVSKNDDLHEILTFWTSPFLAISLISNRNSPLHRDNGGGYPTMDLLMSVGKYRHAWFNVPGLGYNLCYNSGTVIGICGRVVRHGATAEGQRLVWAHYLKINMLQELGITEPDWVQLDNLVSADMRRESHAKAVDAVVDTLMIASIVQDE